MKNPLQCISHFIDHLFLHIMFYKMSQQIPESLGISDSCKFLAFAVTFMQVVLHTFFWFSIGFLIFSGTGIKRTLGRNLVH